MTPTAAAADIAALDRVLRRYVENLPLPVDGVPSQRERDRLALCRRLLRKATACWRSRERLATTHGLESGAVWIRDRIARLQAAVAAYDAIPTIERIEAPTHTIAIQRIDAALYRLAYRVAMNPSLEAAVAICVDDLQRQRRAHVADRSWGRRRRRPSTMIVFDADPR